MGLDIIVDFWPRATNDCRSLVGEGQHHARNGDQNNLLQIRQHTVNILS